MSQRARLVSIVLAALAIGVSGIAGARPAASRHRARAMYRPRPPVRHVPRGHTRIVVGGHPYYYHAGIYYVSGPSGYVVVPAPLGAKVTVLPTGYEVVYIAGTAYYRYYGTYYRYDPVESVYVVAEPPELPPTADVVHLIDGRELEGRFVGGTPATVDFAVDGEVREIPIAEIVSITFEPPSSAPGPLAVPSVHLTIPAGTRLMVRIVDPLVTGEVSSGHRFRSDLDAPLVVDGVQIASEGAPVYGRVVEAERGGRVSGRAKLVLELTDISVNGQIVPIVSDQLAIVGEPPDALETIGAGTVIGGILGGRRGAARGAAAGGVVAVLTPGHQIKVPTGTLFEFRIVQPLALLRG